MFMRDIAKEVKWNIEVFKQSVIQFISMVISMGLILGVIVAGVFVFGSKGVRQPKSVNVQLTREQNQMIQARMNQGQQGSVNVQSEIRNMANIAEEMKHLVNQVVKS